MQYNKAGRFLLVILCLVVYIGTLVINALAGSGNGPFIHSTGNVSALYKTEITPAGWTFSIWGIIYTWLLLISFYFLSLLYRGMYCSPAVLPCGFFLFWVLNMVLNSTWLFLWDRELMIPALICLSLIAVTNYLMILFSCLGLRDHGAWLRHNHPIDLSIIQILVQNGIATYATWTTIATLLNLTVVMTISSVSQTNSATVSLCLLLVEVLVWFTVENFVIEKHVRYIHTVYPVIIYALSGSVSEHYNAEAPSRNAVFTVSLLVLACLLFVIRVVLVIWRHRTRPLTLAHQGEGLMNPL